MREELNFELKRQFVHAIAGIVLASVLFFAGQVSLVYFCIFLIVLIGIGIPVVQKNPRSRLAGIVSAFERQMGALAAALLYPASIALYAILVLCIADAVAPIAGVAAGKHKLPWNKGKSYEGSLGFLIAAIAILLFAEAPLAAFAIAVIVTAVESLPKLDDNVTIPIAAGALMLVI
jgi:dolichol kinase